MARGSLSLVKRAMADARDLTADVFNVNGHRPIQDALLVPTSDLVPANQQPRTIFDRDELKELADNIRTTREAGQGIEGTGILQPLLVRPDTAGSGKFRIIAGERRYRAAVEAGCEVVPVLVRDQAAADAYLFGLIENLQRADLTDTEIGEACAWLKKEKGLNLRQLSQLTGKNLAQISQAVRIHADPKLSEAIERRAITTSHARELVAVPERQRAKLLESVVARREHGDPVHPAELRREIQETAGRSSPELRLPTVYVPPHIQPDPLKKMRTATSLLTQAWQELETVTPAVEARIEIRKELELLRTWLDKLEEAAGNW